LQRADPQSKESYQLPKNGSETSHKEASQGSTRTVEPQGKKKKNKVEKHTVLAPDTEKLDENQETKCMIKYI
jgi:hypothetical protein